MSGDYVYTMYRVDKFYGPDRQVLANISLSFLPGAKIGVLGANGAGKSSLLRIMAEGPDRAAVAAADGEQRVGRARQELHVIENRLMLVLRRPSRLRGLPIPSLEPTRTDEAVDVRHLPDAAENQSRAVG